MVPTGDMSAREKRTFELDRLRTGRGAAIAAAALSGQCKVCCQGSECENGRLGQGRKKDERRTSEITAVVVCFVGKWFLSHAETSLAISASFASDRR
jgi:hypothetical protein